MDIPNKMFENDNKSKIKDKTKRKSKSRPRTERKTYYDNSQEAQSIPSLLFADSSKSFEYAGITYYIIEKSSGKTVDKHEMERKFKENYQVITNTDEILYQCLAHENCYYKSKHLSSIRTHIFSEFYEIPCPQCRKSFKYRSNYSSHFKKIHSQS